LALSLAKRLPYNPGTLAKQGGGAIRLHKPSKFTVQTLKMVGLLNLFNTYEELPEAIASLR